MSKRNRICLATVFFAAFAVWTVAVCFVDVQSIGPQGSAVGFATVNGAFHRLTGVHMALYTITDWLSLIPVAVICGFGLLGLVQWIRRKRLQRVDQSILVLGGFYLVVMAFYLLFENLVINRRPVLIGGFLEASYPSSTTMLALCVLPTAMLRLRSRWVRFLLAALTAFLVIGRLLCGVHWVSDIIGGALLSAGLVTLYRCIISICFSTKL
jgi:undecaprenyl-diphosphatase